MAQNVPLATLTQRFLGQFVDSAVAFAMLLVASGFSMITGTRFMMLMALLGAFFYLLLSDGFEHGQSYGKRMINTRVLDRKTLEPCSYVQSFVRNMTFIFGIIDLVFIFGEERQRLGDKLAGTIVVGEADSPVQLGIGSGHVES